MIRAALIGFVVVAVVGCSGGPATSAGTPSPTPATSVVPDDTSQPSAPPSSAPASPSSAPIVTSPPASAPAIELYSPNEVRYAPTFAMRVIVSGLNVRNRPSTAGTKIGTAPKGSVFLVSDWGVKANGYTWYLGYEDVSIKPGGSVPALPQPMIEGVDDLLTGWLAAGTAADPYLEPIPPRCPSTVNLRNVGAMLDSELANCFGTDAIELTGTYGCGGCGGVVAGTFTPDWLAGPLDYSFLSIDPATQVGPFAVHFPLGGPAAPPEGTIIKVMGHFNDSRSSTCVVAPLDDNDTPKPIAAPVATAYCASRFVATSFVVLGTDPSFPG